MLPCLLWFQVFLFLGCILGNVVLLPCLKVALWVTMFWWLVLRLLFG